MKLDSLLRALPTYQIHNAHDVDITQITADSRQVTPGALFVAYPGVSVDGTRFISDAIQRGAVAIVSHTAPALPYSVPHILVSDARSALAHLVAAWHDFPSRKLRVIGITGTDGKTTTCTLAASILATAGHKVGTITTVAATIGDQHIDTGLHTTTPDAPEIQRYLAQMVDAGVQYAVIEATSEGLAQHRLDAVEFDIAAITNITHEHLYFHKTWENYRDAKAMLFRSLATSFRKPRTAKVAVLNADDNERGAFEYLREIPADQQIVYSINPNFHAARPISNLHASRPISNYEFAIARNIEHSINGLRFTVATPHGELPITSSMIGRFNVSNILAAIGVGMARRVPFDAMREGVAKVKGVVGRMQTMQSEPFGVMVDFAHTPNALRVALETAREITRGRVIVVFGCAGLRDVAKRAMMGQVAGKLADQIVVTAEDPRTESLAAINAQIAEGLEKAKRLASRDYFIVDDRAEAIAFAIKIARSGDLVIVTGKGHERSMCFGTTEYPWSDQEAVKAALA
ncbi:MAG: UDP-N-acetylmuramoyl-L-alanyl-D-glutamate--2,6-diaminopimelate ligase [Chloroflexi bacterium]|nr:UDP-N-acetylmuramoyl-L-alanyl-D-glutamate--2,6-diaminopimelate ligase [Chloroflexota bacterium]